MPFPESLVKSVGTWSGKSRLHLSFMPVDQRVTECESTAYVKSINDEFLVLHYSWEYDGKPERGTMLVACNARLDETTIGWADSWHQSGAVMLLTGVGSTVADCSGTYKVKDHPDWGWRIALSVDGGKLLIAMFNISPEGEEEWAVEAVYERQPD